MVSICSANCFLWAERTYAQHSAKFGPFRSVLDRRFDRATCNMYGFLSTPRALIGLSAKTLWVPSLRGRRSQMNASLAADSCWKFQPIFTWMTAKKGFCFHVSMVIRLLGHCHCFVGRREEFMPWMFHLGLQENLGSS